MFGVDKNHLLSNSNIIHSAGFLFSIPKFRNLDLATRYGSETLHLTWLTRNEIYHHIVCGAMRLDYSDNSEVLLLLDT